MAPHTFETSNANLGNQFESSGWYRALTLQERITSLRRQPKGRLRKPLKRPTAHLIPPYVSSDRLSFDGVSEEEFRRILDEPAIALRDRSSGDERWLRQLAEAFGSSLSESQCPLQDPTSRLSSDEAGFLELVCPLIRFAQSRLHAALSAAYSDRAIPAFDLAKAQGLCHERLLGQLIEPISRTLVLEMRIAQLKGGLQGETPKERFRSFVDRLREPREALRILRAYPVLARQIVACVDNWLDFSLEFLRHLDDDWEVIRSTFSPGADPGKLTALSGGLGDSHRGGKAVLIAEFESGFRIVYKPRSMAVDVHFQELLMWLNCRGDHPPFRTLNVLDRGTHGWAEFIVAEPCESEAAVRRFYERQGGYLALLYALEAGDFHRENLIAAGEHPVLLDLEALFHPRVDGASYAEAGDLAGDALSHSVLRVGLLPIHLWAGEGEEGLDLSGLTGSAGQLTPFPVSCIDDAGTDAMRFTKKRIALGESQNQPSLKGAKVDLLRYVEDLVSGFAAVYRLIVRYRPELLGTDGPLQRFANDEVRVVFLDTQTYAMLLTDGCHPDYLRDGLQRDALFNTLRAAAHHLPGFSKLVSSQIQDLHNGDVPITTTRPGSRDVWTSASHQIPAFFQQSGLSLVQQRLASMSDDDLARQLWVIRGSLATLSPASHGRLVQRRSPRSTGVVRDRGELLDVARAIGVRLKDLSFLGANGAAWIGLTFSGNHRWSVAPLRFDLYDGLAGIVLFLAYLGSISGEERFTALARMALHTWRRELLRERSSLKAIGAFQGWGSAIYLLSHLGSLWNEPALFQEAESYVDLLPALIDADTHFDIIGGSAGCAGALSSLYSVAPSTRILQAATACGERLLATAQNQQHGIGWITSGISRRPVAGFSHGAAGISWALLKIAALGGAERFRMAASAALDYERTLFSTAEGNWLDLREHSVPAPDKDGSYEAESPAEAFAMAWCHGAPGIGLARLFSLEHLDSPDLRADIDAALKVTLSRGFGANHSLCHGDLGNVELLIEASLRQTHLDCRRDLDRIADSLLESVRREGPLCGSPMAVETPGLMTGLAGIGYGFLRLAEPERVPSILALQPPIAPLPMRLPR